MHAIRPHTRFMISVLRRLTMTCPYPEYTYTRSHTRTRMSTVHFTYTRRPVATRRHTPSSTPIHRSSAGRSRHTWSYRWLVDRLTTVTHTYQLGSPDASRSQDGFTAQVTRLGHVFVMHYMQSRSSHPSRMSTYRVQYSLYASIIFVRPHVPIAFVSLYVYVYISFIMHHMHSCSLHYVCI